MPEHSLMSNTPVQREFFMVSIRAWLMLLAINWHVNSATSSVALTFFNDFVHSFRMQLFLATSLYMLFLRYDLKHWWKIRVERIAIPMLYSDTVINLATILMLQEIKGKKSATWASMLYATLRRTFLIAYSPILSDGLFNFMVMQTLFYLPFFILGGDGCISNLYTESTLYGSGEKWMYETESVILMLNWGLWMGHRFLNFKSTRVRLFCVNASLFNLFSTSPTSRYFLPLQLPLIYLGFYSDLLFVIGIAIVLYEIHLRIPLLRFLFSGKIET
ncbi:unnamed protein product [Ranitomeya imitator]|uniref:Uncharacterized protein n=1 Tax=Ranitomeya imitator TaxID=111125 RepID=A0ABN9LR38_9NEOB|nr:unnamed protein product [Ranitomeya imitator]